MSEQRKQDHIDLAFSSRPERQMDLDGLYYEPLFSEHPDKFKLEPDFARGKIEIPLWVSSMTGGTEKAFHINQNLARACKEFGMGMGLGSCRPLLKDQRWEDFDLRAVLGPDVPFYTNFGIAQVEELIDAGKLQKLDEITKRLNATGIIIHINPLQEWAQPEGDRYKRPALDTINVLLEKTKFPIIVKEVGQGFGPKSLAALVQLPLQAIELAGFGGTNFTLLEQARLSSEEQVKRELIEHIGLIGHTCEEMVGWINQMSEVNCQEFIISGGIKDPVKGFRLHKRLRHKNVIGMASQFLKYSLGEYEELEKYMASLIDSLKICQGYLR